MATCRFLALYGLYIFAHVALGGLPPKHFSGDKSQESPLKKD